MRNLFFVLIFCFTAFNLSGQELNCLVTINSDRISGSNRQVYKTLETSLTEYINQNQWTNQQYKSQEKINCAFTITIQKQPSSNRFEAAIQVQAARPVYMATYVTPIININDTDFNFKYDEFQPLNYNETVFESNLISTITYYIYIILGVDADTFQLNGGDVYYKKAREVMLLAQQNGSLGWEDQVGKQNRFSLIDNLTSAKLRNFKNILYNYHRQGLDNFHKNKFKSKTTIASSVTQLQDLHNKLIGNHIIRFFLDAKANEISNIFSGGPRIRSTSKMKEVLLRISPTNTKKWQKIN